MCKSRILSLLLVLVMVLGMFPVGVFATEETQPAMTTEAATETVSVKSAATAVDAGYRLKATSGSVSYADGKECLAGKASIAELYKDDSFQSRVLLAEGVFSADVTMTESGGFRIMFRRSGSKNYYSFRVLKNGTTNLIKTQNSKETTLSTISTGREGLTCPSRETDQKRIRTREYQSYCDGRPWCDYC